MMAKRLGREDTEAENSEVQSEKEAHEEDRAHLGEADAVMVVRDVLVSIEDQDARVRDPGLVDDFDHVGTQRIGLPAPSTRVWLY
jgi:U3 small nucleolar RNA-associated protein 14